MEKEEETLRVSSMAEEDPLFGIADFILLGVLIAGSAYWLFFKNKRNKSDAANNVKAYTIQPTPLSSKQTDSSFISKMKTSGRNLAVFYGSQTGTAEEFAGRLAKEAARYKMKGMVADPEECDMEELSKLSEIPNGLAVFCMATYGEGDPTDNAQEFYEWLQTGDCDLQGVKYAVFGLGNKTYEHYNDMGNYVDKRLEELGAERVFEVGLGDDDANIEEDFITWKDRFWPAVCENFGIEASSEEVSMRQYSVTVVNDNDQTNVYTGEVARLNSYRNQRPPFDAKNPFMSPLKVNRELHKSGDRSCMHIEMEIEGSKMRYDSGDHVAIFPTNDETLVNHLGELLSIDLDTVVSFTNLDEDSSKKSPFPSPCSYRTALLHYLDITSPPRTHVLKELVDYTTDEKEKEQLKLMSGTTPEGKALYHKWVGNARRNIVHILEDLPSCKPALEHLCELLPRLQARYYSISSSPKVHPDRIHITAVMIEYETLTRRINRGVATSWLKRKHQEGNGPKVPIFVRKSQLRLPTRPQIPIVMIGPGTGLAPFRGFIQERNFLKEEGKPVGETVLFFGCRKKAEDYIYEDELTEYINNGLLKVHVAFSRDQPEKVYVTHLLQQQKKEIWRLIGVENGHLYVCGDARSMARDVHEIIVKIVKEEGNMSDSEALAYVKKMEAQKRYSADVWS